MVQVKYLKDKKVTVPPKVLIKMSRCHGDNTSRERVLALVGTPGGFVGRLESCTQEAGATRRLHRRASHGSRSPSTPPCTSNFFSVTRETVSRIAMLNSPLIPNYVLHWREVKVKVGQDSLFCCPEVGDGALTCC